MSRRRNKERRRSSPKGRGDAALGAGLGSLAGKSIGALISPYMSFAGSVMGGAYGAYAGSPGDRKRRGSTGGAIGGILGPLPAALGAYIATGKRDRNPAEYQALSQTTAQEIRELERDLIDALQQTARAADRGDVKLAEQWGERASRAAERLAQLEQRYGLTATLPNKQIELGLSETAAIETPLPAPKNVWQLGDGGVAPHKYSPKIPKLDTKKLPKKFQGHNLAEMDNGDWIMWPISYTERFTPKTAKKGAKKPDATKVAHIYKTERPFVRDGKWVYKDPNPKSRKPIRTAVGGERVGRPGKPTKKEPDKWLRGGLTDEQLQAIQFAHTLKGSPAKRAKDLIKQNGLYVVSHSAGKDSQAMFLYVIRDLKVPDEQVVVIHADLPGADWPSITLPSGRVTPTLQEHLAATVDGFPVKVVVAHWGTGAKTPAEKRGKVKTFKSYVLHRHAVRPDAPSFPSRANRWCTGDLKTAPIRSAIYEELCVRNDLREAGGKASSDCAVVGEPWRIVVSAEGMRAGESHDRAGMDPWELEVDLSKRGRIWFKYLPLHDWTAPTDKHYAKAKKAGKRDVVQYILNQKQEPFWTYGFTPDHMEMIREKAPGAQHGVSRLSCQFCIYSSSKDQVITSQLDPEAYADMCALETQVGSSISMGGERMAARTGILPTEGLLRKVKKTAANAKRIDPWRELGLRNPAGEQPTAEEFTVHDLQLAEIILKGPRASQAKAKRRLMSSRGSSRTHRPVERIQVPEGVTTRRRDRGRGSSAVESYDVFMDGMKIGAIDRVKRSRSNWSARMTIETDGSPTMMAEFFDTPQEAIDNLVAAGRARFKRRRVKQKARSNEPLRAALAENPALQDLKRKLMGRA